VHGTAGHTTEVLPRWPTHRCLAVLRSCSASTMRSPIVSTARRLAARLRSRRWRSSLSVSASVVVELERTLLRTVLAREQRRPSAHCGRAAADACVARACDARTRVRSRVIRLASVTVGILQCSAQLRAIQCYYSRARMYFNALQRMEASDTLWQSLPGHGPHPSGSGPGSLRERYSTPLTFTGVSLSPEQGRELARWTQLHSRQQALRASWQLLRVEEAQTPLQLCSCSPSTSATVTFQGASPRCSSHQRGSTAHVARVDSEV
jgi:hypothetical protein